MKQNITILEKSMSAVQADCTCWAKSIGKIYKPDLIIFIAKSGFLFAEPLSEFFQCPMVEITASRPSNGTKDKFLKIKALIPDVIIRAVLKSRFNYLYHEKKSDRYMEVSDEYRREIHKNHKRILIVDDSVDTGYTITAAFHFVSSDFPEAEIRLASYSVIRFSKKRVSVDFVRYEDQIVMTATSRKSKEYEKFLNTYNSWKSTSVERLKRRVCD